MAEKFLLSRRAAQAVRSLIAPGSSYGSRERQTRSVGGAGFVHPWKITVATDGNGAFRVAVRGGDVAWGAGAVAFRPGVYFEGVGVGIWRVVWFTASTAIPLKYDPRWPNGNVPSCDCECLSKTGDPADGEADGGNIILVDSEAWQTPAEYTDARTLGIVTITEAGATVDQHCLSTITARAIARDEGENPGEGTPPECGNPLNGKTGDDSNPLDHKSGGFYGGGGTGNPLDGQGDGGYTPLCYNDYTTKVA